MKYKFGSEIGWQNGVRANHTIKLDLDLTLSDFLRTRNIAEELALREREIRKEIFQVVLETILLKITEGTGVPWEIPGNDFKTDTRVQRSGSAAIHHPLIQGESLSIRDQLRLVIKLNSDKPLNAMQALRSGNQTVAMSITDDIIFHLKMKYLGITESCTESSIHIDDDGLRTFDVRDKTDTPSN